MDPHRPDPDNTRRHWRARGLCAAAVLLAAVLAAATPLAAQPVVAESAAGTTLDGRAFDLAALRGRVVLMMLWRTDCPVCLDKMPELRANALGWKGKPFDLVTVSLDARRSDAQGYDQVRRLVARESPVWSLWSGDMSLPPAWHAGSRLPVTLIFDSQGRLKARHEGRVPADVWDDVADLLP
jgi:thiol-disulfide isomerase/thioredoxin